MRKIGIIGLGQVGKCLANLLVMKGVDELVLIDQNDELAVGLQNDLLDGLLAVNDQPKIKIQDYAALKDADVVVLAVGKAKLLEDQRFGEITYVGQAIKTIAPQIQASGFSGVLLNLANPNEATTAYLQSLVGLPVPKVIGLGTLLDTARLHRAIAEQVNVSPQAVTGLVYGQHDGYLVPVWSTFKINGQALEQPVLGKKVDPHQANIQAKLNGYYAFNGQGQDVSGVVMWALKVIWAILGNQQISLPVAIFQPQFQTYLSFAAQIGRRGVGNFTLLPLLDLEIDQLKVAAQKIKDQVEYLNSI